jgi:hypothetical protein
MEAYFDKSNDNQAALLDCLAEAARDRKRRLALTTKKMEIAAKNVRFEQRLQLAKALNNTEELNRLLEEAKADLMNNDSEEED